MQNFLRKLDRVIELIAVLFGYLAAVSTIVLTFVVSYGVVVRSIFNNPQIWTDQIASYSMLWIVFFGLGYTLSTGGHIRVDFFTQLLPLRGTREREIVVWVLGFVFSLLLFFGCYSVIENFVRRNTHSTVGFQIPLYWPGIPMLLGSGLFSLMMLTGLIRICMIGLVPWPSDDGDRQP